GKRQEEQDGGALGVQAGAHAHDSREGGHVVESTDKTILSLHLGDS
ncbi:unnamed protein product, partial [Ectocarpus sp. 12 AP-2014]